MDMNGKENDTLVLSLTRKLIKLNPYSWGIVLPKLWVEKIKEEYGETVKIHIRSDGTLLIVPIKEEKKEES